MGKYYYGSFHGVSRDIFEWISNQPYVKEESITDRIVYELNKNNPFVACYEFKRNEESINGADWEWWLLLDDFNNSSSEPAIAYKFRVQAKKLLQHGKNNAPLFHYANRNGFQIEQLINNAENDYALPLYALYTCEFLDNNNNIDVFLSDKIPSLIPNLCSNCWNGVYILSAYDIFKNYVRGETRKVTAADLLSKSLPLSLIDYLIRLQVTESLHGSIYKQNGVKYFDMYYDDWINRCTYRYDSSKNEQFASMFRKLLNEMCSSRNYYNYNDFPPYIKTIISSKDLFERSNIYNFDESEKQAEHSFSENTCGFGLIDCRNTIRRKNIWNNLN